MINRRTLLGDAACLLGLSMVPKTAQAWIPETMPLPSVHAKTVSQLPWRIEANALMQTVTLYDYRTGQEEPVAAWRAAVPPPQQLPEETIHGRVQSIVPWPSWTPTPAMVAKGYSSATITGGRPDNPMGNCKIVVGGQFGARHLHAFRSGSRTVFSEGCFSIENSHMIELLAHLGGSLEQPPRHALREGIELIFTLGKTV